MAPKSKENPKKRQSKDSSEQTQKKQKNVKMEAVKKEAVKQQKEQLVSKCRPGQLVDIMKDLNVAQKAAIRETGFGGMLHLNVRTIPTTIIEWILDAFNPSSHLFVANKLEFLLTKEDIHDIFGVPRGGEPVEKKSMNHIDEEEFEAVRSKWRNMFQVTDKKEPVRLQHLYSRLKTFKESGESGEEFKRLFVLVSMSCFLAPTSNYTLDIKILRAVENVDAIKNYDWSSYIFQRLIHSLEKFKTNKTKGVSGCIMALIIAYFHRIAFKGIESPHSIPLLQYWDAETFKERVAEELKCGSLGCGPVTKISYPICVNYEAEAVQKQQQQPPQKQQQQPEPQKQPPQKQQQQPQKQPHTQPEPQVPEGYMLIKLPAGTLSEQEIKEQAVDDVHEIVLRMKNDAEIFYARYAENMEEFKLKMEKLKADRAQPQEKPTEAKSKSPILSPTQPIFKDGLFHSYIDGLVERAKATKDFAQGMPSFDILSEMLDAQYSTLSRKYGETECEQTIEYNEAVNIGSDKEDEDVNLQSVITRVVDSVNEDQVVAVAPAPRMISNYLLHSNIVPSGVHLIPEELGCTIDCGQPDVGMPLVSGLLKSNKILFDPVLKLRKQVMDYCFFTNAKLVKPERLASYGLVYFIGVEEMETLLPDVKIDSAVIDCWAILLNKLTSLRKDAPRPRRLFFGLSHSSPLEKYMDLMNEAEAGADALRMEKLNALTEEIDSSWKEWLGVCNKNIDDWFEKDNDEADAMPDLVFLPLFIGEHYFCVCINFINNTVDYLDNRTYVDFEVTAYAHLAKLTVVKFGKFLISKNVEAGRMLLESKPMRIQNFNWTSNEGNLDCGVFLMFHMLFYDGKVFDSELHDKRKRILYRAEIAATLVLSDYNECRPEMLASTALFSEKKQHSKNPKTPTTSKSDGKKAACVTVLGSPKTSKSDGLGSTLDFGNPTETVLLISRFLRSNQPMFSKMMPLRKRVVDYCLVDDCDLPPSETVAFYNTEDFLEREDIMSLRSTVSVTSRVIECWAHLMNQIDHSEPGETSLMFFGIRHADTIYSIYQNELEGNQVFDSKYKSVCLVWDRFVKLNSTPCNLKAQLVFVPMVYEDHYFCVCLNFKKGKVEILENRRYKDWESTPVYKIAEIIVKCMSLYLNEKGVPTAKELEGADLVNLPLEWQEEEANNEESGCFLMIHMIRYEGELFVEELKRKVYRRYYWAEIAAALLLADINGWRDKLLDKVSEFEKKKEKVWEQLKEKRLVKPKKGTSKRKEISTEEPILRTAAEKQQKGKKKN